MEFTHALTGLHEQQLIAILACDSVWPQLETIDAEPALTPCRRHQRLEEREILFELRIFETERLDLFTEVSGDCAVRLHQAIGIGDFRPQLSKLRFLSLKILLKARELVLGFSASGVTAEKSECAPRNRGQQECYNGKAPIPRHVGPHRHALRRDAKRTAEATKQHARLRKQRHLFESHGFREIEHDVHILHGLP
jgi:hypothetical protein